MTFHLKVMMHVEFRKVLHTTRVHFVCESIFRLSILSSHQRLRSRRRSTIQTSMRKVKSAYQSLVLKTGNLQRELIKVQ